RDGRQPLVDEGGERHGGVTAALAAVYPRQFVADEGFAFFPGRRGDTPVDTLAGYEVDIAEPTPPDGAGPRLFLDKRPFHHELRSVSSLTNCAANGVACRTEKLGYATLK